MTFFKYLFYNYYKFLPRLGIIMVGMDAIWMIVFPFLLYFFGGVMLIFFFFDAKMPGAGVSISTFMLVALSLYIFLYYHFQYKGKERKLLKECEICFAKVSSIWAILYYVLSFVFLSLPFFLMCAKNNGWI